MKTKVTHLTSVHPRFDTRVFYRNCKVLHDEIYEVNFIVADGNGDTIEEGINIFDVGLPKNRVDRIKNTTKKVLKKALALNSDIYHFHDPELIPVGLKLKKLGYKVIFDIHENVFEQIKVKHYLPNYVALIISYIYSFYEKNSLHKFDQVVLAENSYEEYYKKFLSNYTIVLNMPNVDFFKKFYNGERTKNEIFYIGAISNDRGLDTTIAALKILKKRNIVFTMNYIGKIEKSLVGELNLDTIEKDIVFHGRMNLDEGYKLSKNSKVGLSVLKPIKNYETSYSTKIFEYMAIGLPVITSKFKLYEDVIEKYDCGICIDPYDANALANAIERLFNNKQLCNKYRENGLKTLDEHFNWKKEKRKLLNIYKKVLS